MTSSICRFVTILARLSAWLALARTFSARGAATRWALPAATGPTFALVSDKEKGKSFSPSGKEKGAPTRPGLPVGPGERTARSPQGDHGRGQEKNVMIFTTVAHGGVAAHPLHARRHRLEPNYGPYSDRITPRLSQSDPSSPETGQPTACRSAEGRGQRHLARLAGQVPKVRYGSPLTAGPCSAVFWEWAD